MCLCILCHWGEEGQKLYLHQDLPFPSSARIKNIKTNYRMRTTVLLSESKGGRVRIVLLIGVAQTLEKAFCILLISFQLWFAFQM